MSCASIQFDVLLFALQDLLEQIAAAVVAEAPALLDAVVEHADGGALDVEVQAELLGHGLADADLAEPLHVGHALEEEDALDELVGVAHLADRFLAHFLPEAL